MKQKQLPNMKGTTMETNTMTGYQLAKVTNAYLKELGLKEIPTQMVYNYMKNRLIKSTTQGTITHQVGEEWMFKYLNKRVEKDTK